MRRADAVETAEAWEIALLSRSTPVMLILSRQNLPTVRTLHTDENLSARGAYVLSGGNVRDVTLIATGSELEIAMKAADQLAAEGLRVAVVSAPSIDLFAAQSADYRAEVLGEAPRIGVEAALRMGWDGILRDHDAFVGMTGFGASAPASDLYRHFNITADAVVRAAKSMI